MESRICLGGEWVSTPKFAIGDAVAHCYHGLNDDDLSPKKWHCFWYRGIVIGVYYNRVVRPRTGWKGEGWVYIVEIFDSSNGDEIDSWKDITEEFPEDDLKPSHRHARAVAARCNRGKENSPASPPPPVLIARCKAG